MISEETRSKLRAARARRPPPSAETRAKMSASLKGRPSPLKGKPRILSEATIEATRQRMLGNQYGLGWRPTPEQIKKSAEGHRLPAGVRAERKKAAFRKWYQANRERVLEKKSQEAKASPARRREYNKTYNPLWRSQNRELVTLLSLRHRRRKQGARGSYSLEEWREKCLLLDSRCFYCHRTDLKLTADHLVPPSRGGSDYITNIVPACRPCNSRKRDKTYEEYVLWLAS